MKLTLHIGHGKTGSTSIQNSLFAMRDELRQHGWLFPETLHIRAKHHWLLPLIFDEPLLAVSVVNRMGFSVEAAKKAALDEWENLLRQLEGESVSNLIFSSEVLFRPVSHDEVTRAREYLLTIADEIQAFAYVRSPVKRYLSTVQQRLKSCNQIIQPMGTNVAGILEKYQLICGQPVKTRVFEKSKLRNEDVVADFVDWISLPAPPDLLPKMRSNETVSAEAMAVLHEISPPKRPANSQEQRMKRKRFKAVQIADRSVEAPTKPVLKPEIAEYLTAQCTELPLLRDQYGLEFEDIDYSLVRDKASAPLEITQIDEICSYNKARKELVLLKAKENLEKSLKHEAQPSKENRILRKLKAFLRPSR